VQLCSPTPSHQDQYSHTCEYHRRAQPKEVAVSRQATIRAREQSTLAQANVDFVLLARLKTSQNQIDMARKPMTAYPSRNTLFNVQLVCRCADRD